jgi:hypothetical protein
MALQVVDRAIQAFGAEGLSQDQELASTFANIRTLRIADVSCSEFSLRDHAHADMLLFYRALTRSVVCHSQTPSGTDYF